MPADAVLVGHRCLRASFGNANIFHEKPYWNSSMLSPCSRLALPDMFRERLQMVSHQSGCGPWCIQMQMKELLNGDVWSWMVGGAPDHQEQHWFNIQFGVEQLIISNPMTHLLLKWNMFKRSLLYLCLIGLDIYAVRWQLTGFMYSPHVEKSSLWMSPWSIAI